MLRLTPQRLVALVVVVAVAAAACGSGEESPTATQDDSQAAPARTTGAAPSEPEQPEPEQPDLERIDLGRLDDLLETLDPEAECPPPEVPESYEGVAEIVRIDAGCLDIEYIPLEGRSVDELYGELHGSDPTIVAVDTPAIDRVPDVLQPSYSDLPPSPYDEDDYGAGDWWHLDRLDAEQLWSPNGWEFSDSSGEHRRVPGWRNDNEVIVAVVDTGTDASHRDFSDTFASGVISAPTLIALPYAAVLFDSCNREDTNGHGTHVAGLVAADHRNGADIAGIAPNAKILPIAALGPDPQTTPCYSTTVALNAARLRGVDVVSMSFGGDYNASAYAALTAAHEQGIVLVSSAGNCGDQNNLSVFCASVGQNRTQYPAAHPDVIAIAAIDSADDRARFSTSNNDVDFAAPGDGASAYSGLLSTVPLLACTQGTDAIGDFWIPLGCGLDNPPAACDSTVPLRTSRYTRPNACAHRTAHKPGTSMAAPLASGVIAHMIARYPNATPDQIFDALTDTAHNPDGQGQRTNDYGHGIINPVAAIQALSELLSPPETPSSLSLPPEIPAVGVDDDPGERTTQPTGTTALDSGMEGSGVLSVGATHSCALRANQTITCWGDNQHGQTDSPAGEFIAVSTSWGSSCGLTTNNKIVCWGSRNVNASDVYAVSRAPCGWDESLNHSKCTEFDSRDVSFTALGDACALMTDQTIACFDEQGLIPAGHYTYIAGGSWHQCAVSVDQSVVCWEWGIEQGGFQWGAPMGKYTAVAVGSTHSCGIKVDQTITCWSLGIESTLGAPAGQYTAIAGGGPFPTLGYCGIRVDRTIRCWEFYNVEVDGEWKLSLRNLDAPSGWFTAISVSDTNGCGLRTDGTITCWGNNE
ncbi:MAG: S8 family serine peptidase, partial [Acidimicrobiaceae bacterium]|nr:S8 family serine peptidase [Acidimicrobiaceae bacterium]